MFRRGLEFIISAFSLLLSVHHMEQEQHIHLSVHVIETASVKLIFYQDNQWFFYFDWISLSPHWFQILSKTWFVKHALMLFLYQISSLKRKFDFGWIAFSPSLIYRFFFYCFNVGCRVQLLDVHNVKRNGLLAWVPFPIWQVLATSVEYLFLTDEYTMNIVIFNGPNKGMCIFTLCIQRHM